MGSNPTRSTKERDMQITLENIVIAVCMVGYLVVGVSYALKGNVPWSITWLSYGLANVGLILAQSQT